MCDRDVYLHVQAARICTDPLRNHVWTLVPTKVPGAGTLGAYPNSQPAFVIIYVTNENGLILLMKG